ncbi:MAG: type III-A CRISPR-associated RAMP protein Csm5 [Treponema sp.]|jgi:CRISPR-associated protein Csm5|nr:type III-A CRISPR-associated RAMP protein Csm5 [Treponema sp.]
MVRKVYTLTPLTGIHIGTGEELTFLDYKIASLGDSKEKKYIKFSNDRILQRLWEDEQKRTAFERASVNGNMKELQKFFQNNCTCADDIDYICEITGEFLKTYNDNWDKDPYQNAAKVLQMYRSQGTPPRPVIPGSSLKGSIRTALLNIYLEDLYDLFPRDYENLLKYFKQEKYIVKENKDFKQEKNFVKENNMLQQKLLDYRDAKDDPLRAVSIPDCPFKARGTQLVGGLKLVPLSLDPLETQIQAEVIKGELLGGNAPSELCISIDDKLQKTPFSLHWKDSLKCLKTITFDDIRKSCNDFYWGEFKEEYKKFYINASGGTKELIDKLEDRLEEAITKGQFIIRVGRWSQVEFVTFEENFRKPETRVVRGKQLESGTTRTLFDYDGKYVPMGWCVLSEKEE